MMVRPLYAFLVRLHPPEFRRRFGGEMLSVFDQFDRFAARAALLGDAAVSLTRQWLFRPEFHASETPLRQPAAALPMFHVLDDDPRLTPGQWISGALCSLLTFTAASTLIGLGGLEQPTLIAGLKSPETGVTRATDQASARKLAAVYFHSILVLEALDTNRDLVLSSDEIADAPRALRQLDLNGDGALEPWECRSKSARSLKMLLDDASFMAANPVLNALDTNRDSIISAAEILHSPEALRNLDLNHDGKLTLEELLPSQMLEARHE